MAICLMKSKLWRMVSIFIAIFIFGFVLVELNLIYILVSFSVFFKNMIIFDFTNIRYFVGIYFSYSPLQHLCKTRFKEQAKTYPR